ncbi:MAG: mechanosensitive ion channel [Opitutales bacterium]|nr:mechanosensitive ion channel [Opitutales bacterium]
MDYFWAAAREAYVQQGTLLALGVFVLLILGERWWPRRWRAWGEADWRRHTVFPAALAFYTGGLFILSLGFEQPFFLLGRVALLLLVWMIIPRICAFLREAYWIRAGELALFLLSAVILLPELRMGFAFLDTIRVEAGDFRISVAGILQGVVILVFALYVGLGLARLLEEQLEQVNGLSPSLRVLIGKVARILLLVIAGVMAVDAVGIDVTVLKFLGGGLGLGLGFGLQKVVSNLISGFILLADRSIKPGDVIEVEGSYGWINNLRARFVSVITRDGKEHLIPNEDLITQRVINWSFSNSNVRVHLDFGVSYKSDVHQVRKVVLACVAEEARILKSPAPVCFITSFGDSSVDFQLRFWLCDPQNGLTNIRSAVYFRIWDAFKANGIEIPFPQRDVHLRLPDGLPRGGQDPQSD